ncbi:ALA-interacting subunit 5 [Astathelohania contejeani]|uniref:ALA-interacting subunit 5 n=1 Tax=Astathelohania contejeani TaxID=164912 RepID=A0ABQ7I0S4_9MICR|nr:ALA-interacting subunit 5 [Thelohania contejeani]
MNIARYINEIKTSILKQKLPGSYRKDKSILTWVIMAILAIFNLSFGVIIMSKYNSLFQITIPYKTSSTPEIITYNFSVPKRTKAPLFFYVQLEGFYQNYLGYGKSINYDQLSGKATKDIKSCKPIEKNGNIIIYPCGLVANTFLQDNFNLFKGSKYIPISEEDISWPSEKSKFGDTEYTLDEIEAPPLWKPYKFIPKLGNNNRFINWMQISALSSFRKLYGKIDEGLEAGEYRIEIESTFPYSKKSVVFLESSWCGSKNFFLANYLLVVGGLLMTFTFVTFFKMYHNM